MVGDHETGAIAGTSDLGVGGLRPPLDQLHHAVEVAKPMALPMPQHHLLDACALGGDRAGVGAPAGGQRGDRLRELALGLGVIDSQVARLTMAGRLTTTDHKVRMRRMDTTVAPPQSATGSALEPRLYTDPALLEAEQELIFERTWQLAGHVSALPADRQLPDRPGRDPAGARDPRRARRPARLSQRLPPSRLAAAERIGAVQGGDPLPLPRVDLPPRRHPDRRARGAGLRRQARQGPARPDAGARRGDVRAGVRQPRSRRDAAGRARRRPARSGWLPTGSTPWSRSPCRAAAVSRRTGRWWPTTTSRATTSRSPIPA